MKRRIFKTRHFARWMGKARLPDDVLCQAVDEMARGLIDADMGGGVVKKRVRLPGRGKSGGARTLVATNREDRWFFVFGFKKNEQENVRSDDLAAIKKYSSDLLSLGAEQLNNQCQRGDLQELCDEN